jgi:hypothetical protein
MNRKRHPKPSRVDIAIHGLRKLPNNWYRVTTKLKEYTLHPTKGWRCHTIRD